MQPSHAFVPYWNNPLRFWNRPAHFGLSTTRAQSTKKKIVKKIPKISISFGKDYTIHAEMSIKKSSRTWCLPANKSLLEEEGDEKIPWQISWL